MIDSVETQIALSHLTKGPEVNKLVSLFLLYRNSFLVPCVFS